MVLHTTSRVFAMDISPINSVANNVNTAGFMAGGGFKKAFLSLVFQIPFAKGV
jgi:hypothetical protein